MYYNTIFNVETHAVVHTHTQRATHAPHAHAIRTTRADHAHTPPFPCCSLPHPPLMPTCTHHAYERSLRAAQAHATQAQAAHARPRHAHAPPVWTPTALTLSTSSEQYLQPVWDTFPILPAPSPPSVYLVLLPLRGDRGEEEQ